MEDAEKKHLVRRLYIHMFLSFGVGFIILLWAYGIYGIIKTLKIFFYPQYVALVFALFYIAFSVFLEHRGVEMPYLLLSGAILSSLATFFFVCVINGALWLYKMGFPDFNTFLFEISICSVIAFIIIKII